jgi:endonuclease YncB( thermonuclease family)
MKTSFCRARARIGAPLRPRGPSGRLRALRGFGVAAAIALGLGAPSPRAFAACGTPAGAARVVSVDARLDIALDDRRVVRLDGLDLPDSTRGRPETAKGAQEFLTARLAGREASVAALAPAPDRWGRVLGDLVTSEPSGGSAALALLAAGWARVRPQFETRACAEERLKSEAEARAQGLGSWGDPAYAVIDAAKADAVKGLGGRFVVVGGVVRRVGFGRSRLYLDLGPRDSGVSIVVARRLTSAFARAGKALETMKGRKIRARGALDDRFAPRIEVSDPSMIELVQD